MFVKINDDDIKQLTKQFELFIQLYEDKFNKIKNIKDSHKPIDYEKQLTDITEHIDYLKNHLNNLKEMSKIY